MHHGQEIFSFFYIYGYEGLLGIILSSILITIIIYKTLIISKKYNIKNYDELLNKTIKKKIIKNLIKLIINTFLIISFYIMVAGFTAFFQQQFNFNKMITAIIFCIFCYLIFNKNIEKIIKINTILIPIIIIIFLIFGIKNINYINDEKIIRYKNNWIISSILYTSYNTITLIGLTSIMYKYLKTKKEYLKVAIFTGIIILVIATIIFLLLVNMEENIEIPILYISNFFGGIYKYLYGILILIAIFTTAISEGYTFLQNISKGRKRKVMNILMCITAIPISSLGFSNLVNKIYPVFGIIGLLQIIFILNTN